MDEKEQLARAKALIQKRKFDKAREILKWIPDSPTAQKWLEKLDQIAPEGIEPFPLLDRKVVIVKKEKRPLWKHCLYLIGAMILCLGPIYIVYWDQNVDTSVDCNGMAGDDRAKCIVNNNVDGVRRLTVGDEKITVIYRLDRANLSVDEYRIQAHQDFARMICQLRTAGFTGQSFDFTAQVIYVDELGHEDYVRGISAVISSASSRRIGCDNVANVNIRAVADEYYIHPEIG